MKTPASAIRWSIAGAAPEFGVHAKTLSARLKTAGIAPGPDGQFSTREICRAVFSDLTKERTRLTREEANLKELDRKAREGELMETAEVRRVWSDQILRWRQLINNWDVAPAKKAELLKEMAA